MMRLTLLFLLTTLLVSAQEFKASWIAATTDKQTTPNTWYCYRKSFDLNNIPLNLIAKISTDTKYWLWINGKLIVYEGGLKRGPNPSDTYYDEVNLSKPLRKGKNTVAVLVWFWGGKGFSHNNSGQSALMFDCATHQLNLNSDRSWKAIKYDAYMPSNAPNPNFRLSEPNILYDARKEIANWTSATYDDKDWQQAQKLGKAPMAPWNKLVKRPIPLFKFDDLKHYPATEKIGDTLICHLPYDGQFSPYLKVRAKAGQKIFISSDTWWLGTYPGDTLNTLCSEYITKDGLQEYESLGWLSGHEIRYTIPSGVEVESVMYRESGYASELTGSFNCDDPFLNKLWQKSQRSLYVNMRDNYMDCPDRERAQWAGDAAIEMAQAFYSLDVNSNDLSRKLYLDLAGWQRSDSTIYNPVPETGWKNELPAHSLMPLSELWRYFLFTKDTATVKHVYPAMRKYLAVWQMEENGQLIYRKGGWDWGDWGEHIDFVLIQHGWYLLALQTAAKIAVLIGEEADHELFSKKINQLKSFLNSPDCWNGKAYRHKDYKKETDDRANALMVMSGVADSSKWNLITDVFSKEEHASPWMEKLVLESLIKMHQPELALLRMKKRYKAMVESRLTTLWESWEHKEGVVHGNSGYNHGWAGGPLILLSQYYAGIFPDETKANAYVIRPMLAGLHSIKTNMPTRNGNMQLSIQQSRLLFQLSCTVPKGLSATIGLPKQGYDLKKITLNNTALKDSKTVKIKGEDTDNFWIQVKDGNYNFSMKP